MGERLGRAGLFASAAAATALLAACGGGSEAPNAVDANAIDANVMLEESGNDQSAMESAANASEPIVTDTGNQSTNATGVLGNTSGGDTGGNTVGNASGT